MLPPPPESSYSSLYKLSVPACAAKRLSTGCCCCSESFPDPPASPLPLPVSSPFRPQGYLSNLPVVSRSPREHKTNAVFWHAALILGDLFSRAEQQRGQRSSAGAGLWEFSVQGRGLFYRGKPRAPGPSAEKIRGLRVSGFPRACEDTRV